LYPLYEEYRNILSGESIDRMNERSRLNSERRLKREKFIFKYKNVKNSIFKYINPFKSYQKNWKVT